MNSCTPGERYRSTYCCRADGDESDATLLERCRPAADRASDSQARELHHACAADRRTGQSCQALTHSPEWPKGPLRRRTNSSLECAWNERPILAQAAERGVERGLQTSWAGLKVRRHEIEPDATRLRATPARQEIGCNVRQPGPVGCARYASIFSTESRRHRHDRPCASTARSPRPGRR